MERMIAFCGLICTECEGFLATQANDEQWKERLAQKAREEFNSPEATAAEVTCDGCLTFSGRLCAYCSQCEIRACGVGRGIENCGVCTDYTSREKISAFVQMVPAVKPNLDSIYAGLS